MLDDLLPRRQSEISPGTDWSCRFTPSTQGQGEMRDEQVEMSDILLEDFTFGSLANSAIGWLKSLVLADLFYTNPVLL